MITAAVTNTSTGHPRRRGLPGPRGVYSKFVAAFAPNYRCERRESLAQVQWRFAGKVRRTYTSDEMDDAAPLARTLASMTRPGTLCDPLPDGAVRCYACGHNCLIPKNRPGVC